VQDPLDTVRLLKISGILRTSLGNLGTKLYQSLLRCGCLYVEKEGSLLIQAEGLVITHLSKGVGHYSFKRRGWSCALSTLSTLHIGERCHKEDRESKEEVINNIIWLSLYVVGLLMLI